MVYFLCWNDILLEAQIHIQVLWFAFQCCAVLSHLVLSNSLQPHGLQLARLLWPWGFSRQEYWSGLPCPPPGDHPNPRIESRSPALQADSLPSEPPGNPKSTGVSSLSFSRGSSLSRNQTGVSRIAGGFFTSWATRKAQGEAKFHSIILTQIWVLASFLNRSISPLIIVSRTQESKLVILISQTFFQYKSLSPVPVAIYDTQSSGIPKEHTLYYFLCIAFSTWLPRFRLQSRVHISYFD